LREYDRQFAVFVIGKHYFPFIDNRYPEIHDEQVLDVSYF